MICTFHGDCLRADKQGDREDTFVQVSPKSKILTTKISARNAALVNEAGHPVLVNAGIKVAPGGFAWLQCLRVALTFCFTRCSAGVHAVLLFYAAKIHHVLLRIWRSPTAG